MKGRGAMFKSKTAVKAVQKHRAGKVARDPKRKELLGKVDSEFVALQHSQISSKGSNVKVIKKTRKPVCPQEIESSMKQFESLLRDS